jgi:hypothetical protein
MFEKNKIALADFMVQKVFIGSRKMIDFAFLRKAWKNEILMNMLSESRLNFRIELII